MFMGKAKQLSIIAVAILVLISGTFVGLAAHVDGNGNSYGVTLAEMSDNCPVMNGTSGGMVRMLNDCPVMGGTMDTMGMNTGNPSEYSDCPMQ